MTRFSGLFVSLFLAPFLAAGFAAPGEAAQVTVTRSDCQNVVRHTPSPDVEYKPGVDVYDRKVAPADLPGSPQIKLPDVISFDLNVELEELAGAPPAGPVGQVYGEPNLGKVEIRGHQVYFNGRPLGGIDQSELVRKCREALSATK